MSKFIIFFGAVLAAGAALPLAAQAKLGVEDASAYLLPVAEEVEMARSAAPASISAGANVLTLQADGSYRTEFSGSNGWTCFVGRSWTGPAPRQDGKRIWSEGQFDPEIRAPQCFNKSASGSILALHRLTTERFMRGASTAEVDLAIGTALASGDIQAPEHGAMSYMYSPMQRIGPRRGAFRPHLMLYMPYATQEDFGQRNDTMTVPMVSDGGSVFATTVVMSSHWSDGTPVE